MKFRKQDGISGVDIIISVIALTIFVTVIGTLITDINLISMRMDRKMEAITYATKEIENIKKQGYLASYDERGVEQAEIISDRSIDSTGYNKKITIEDYKLLKNSSPEIQQDVLKKLTIEISYKVGKNIDNVQLSTYVINE